MLRPNKFYIEDGTTSESSTSSSSMLCACCFNCKTASSTFATRYWLECCNRSLNWTNSITWSTVEWDLYITDTNARRSEDKSYIGYYYFVLCAKHDQEKTRQQSFERKISLNQFYPTNLDIKWMSRQIIITYCVCV